MYQFLYSSSPWLFQGGIWFEIGSCYCISSFLLYFFFSFNLSITQPVVFFFFLISIIFLFKKKMSLYRTWTTLSFGSTEYWGITMPLCFIGSSIQHTNKTCFIIFRVEASMFKLILLRNLSKTMFRLLFQQYSWSMSG